MRSVLIPAIALAAAASSALAGNSYSYHAVPQITSPAVGQVFNVDLYIREFVTDSSKPLFLDPPTGGGALIGGGFVVNRNAVIPASPSKLIGAASSNLWDAAVDPTPSDSSVDLTLTTFILLNTVDGVLVAPDTYEVHLGTATIQAGGAGSSTGFTLDQHLFPFDDFIYELPNGSAVIDNSFQITPAIFTVSVVPEAVSIAYVGLSLILLGRRRKRP